MRTRREPSLQATSITLPSMTLTPRPPIWALTFAFVYILSTITTISALLSPLIHTKATKVCEGSQHFTAPDLNATHCEVLVGSTWLYATSIDSIVRLDKDHYIISNGVHSLFLNGSVYVDGYGDLDEVKPSSTGRITISLNHPSATRKSTYAMTENGVLSSARSHGVLFSSLTSVILSTMKDTTATSPVSASRTVVLPTTVYAPSKTLLSTSSSLKTDHRSLTDRASSSRSKSSVPLIWVTQTLTSTVQVLSTTIAGKPP